MFEGNLKDAFPDYLLSSYFYAGEGEGVGVTLDEDYSFDAVISVTFLLYFSSSPSSITLLTACSMSSTVISLRNYGFMVFLSSDYLREVHFIPSERLFLYPILLFRVIGILRMGHL